MSNTNYILSIVYSSLLDYVMLVYILYKSHLMALILDYLVVGAIVLGFALSIKLVIYIGLTLLLVLCFLLGLLLVSLVFCVRHLNYYNFLLLEHCLVTPSLPSSFFLFSIDSSQLVGIHFLSFSLFLCSNLVNQLLLQIIFCFEECYQ